LARQGSRGRHRQLADTIVAAVELFNATGRSFDPTGTESRSAVNWSDMRELADKTICGVPLVRRDGVWREEYFTYRFDPPRRPDPLQGAGRSRIKISITSLI
jgi:hypothetical protein